MKNFEICVAKVFQDEGGYTNDPADSGGKTNFGITQKETSIDVKTITKEQAKAIYKKKYWDALDCDNLPAGVDYTVFDYGVNSGVGRASKVYKSFKTLEPLKAIDAINNERQTFLNNLVVRRPKDKKFLKGWTARVARVRAFSKQLAGKKDMTSGPAVGGAAGLSFWAVAHNFIVAHPYVSIAAAVAVGAGIWALVHWIRNK